MALVRIFWHGLYNGAQCLVKMGAGLSRPIPVQRGIRQGCPISGQLYSLAIGPLLCRLRSKLSGPCRPPVGWSFLLRSLLMLTMSAFSSPARVTLSVCRTPCPGMRGPPRQGSTGPKVVHYFWDAGGSRWFLACLEAFSGKQRDYRFWEFFWAPRLSRLKREQRRRCALGCPNGSGCFLRCPTGEEFWSPILIKLFLLNPEELDQSGLTPFYTSVLQAWHTFKFTRATSEMPGMWVFEEPLFFNGLLRARTLVCQPVLERPAVRK
ncbi:hypothetical protein NHX12_023355 [Muraenolepis orangiensis]|uniref:Uncharacterized protein n=1 Tax=Muraenolepis orangiensis TaxID=630683 RepID=A0A9Q0ENJ1_9TELE|nr:hypothetical protein NHX12_023355 [Muraenolepis orangiensis]